MADLRVVSRRARRHLLRYRGVLSALLAALAVLAVIRSVAPPDPPSQAVVVAARDLDSGRVLTADDLTTVRLPPPVVPAGSTPSLAMVAGRVVAAPMREGEVVTDRRLLGAALLAGYPAGVVAAPVRISDGAVVALLQVGVRIDVYAAVSDSVAAALVVQRAPVLALPRGDVDNQQGGLIVLAVAPAQAASLAQAGATAPLSITLRR